MAALLKQAFAKFKIAGRNHLPAVGFSLT